MYKYRTSCAIGNCTAKKQREFNGNLTFHLFPNSSRSPKLREQWIEIVKRSRNNFSWEPKQNTRICSRHFDKTCFTGSPFRALLQPDSTPTVFIGEEESVYDQHILHPDEPLIEIAEDPPLETPSCYRNALFIAEVKSLVPVLGYALFGILAMKSVKPIDDKTGTSRKRVGSILDDETPKRRCIVTGDHSYQHKETPRTRCRRLLNVNMKAKKKLYLLRKNVTRKKKSVQVLLNQIEDASLLTKKQLEACGGYSKVMKLLMEANVKKKTVEYSEDMKQFAATLHFYSPKAYEFLREHIRLPHSSTIASWMKSANCEPGFCSGVIANLNIERQRDKKNCMTDIAMIVDEMAIRKDTVWDPSRHKYMGYCDYGDGPVECNGLASNALVCIIAGISGGWKCPIGYMFTDKCEGKILSTFVSKGLQYLTESGFRVHSITADGGTANVTMFAHLGISEEIKTAELDIVQNNIKPYFTNPLTENPVYAIYDVVHMIKLWRNLLADLKEISWRKGVVKWSFIEKLNELQHDEHISAANKINKNHIEFQKHKMRMKYAAQTISASTANAVDFCCEDMGLQQFKDSKPTTEFLRLLDKTFDILNSRHPKQSGFKAPLTKENLKQNIPFLEYVCNILLEVKYEKKSNRKGVITYKTSLLCKGQRKRAVIGLYISIKSVIAISQELLRRENQPFYYVMTYRFSQDLLELFFNKVRSKLGKNDNPNVLQFTNIMKQVWHQNLLKSNSTGNCINLDDDIPKGLLKLKCSKSHKPSHENAHSSVDDINIPEFQNVETHFYENCLTYIAGNVVHTVADTMKCSDCLDCLYDNSSDALPVHLKNLIIRKNNGGLTTPSYSVYKICKKADGYFKALTSNLTRIPNLSDLDGLIQRKVMVEIVGMDLFPTLGHHTIDFDPVNQESHFILIIKTVIRHFLKIRLFSHGKAYRREIMGTSLRHSLNKTTLFRNE